MSDDDTAQRFRGKPGDDTIHDRDRRLAGAVEDAMREQLEDDVGLRFSHGRLEDGGDYASGPCLLVRVRIEREASAREERVVLPESAIERHGEKGAVQKAVRSSADAWPEFGTDRGGAPPVGDRAFSGASSQPVPGEDATREGDAFPAHPDPSPGPTDDSSDEG